MKSDVLVVGAGPAGLATAIAAAANGLRVVVADARRPPINKPCGEGLLPEAVDALRSIGIELDSSLGCPLKGFRFSDDSYSVSAPIERGRAFELGRGLMLRPSFLALPPCVSTRSRGFFTSSSHDCCYGETRARRNRDDEEGESTGLMDGSPAPKAPPPPRGSSQLVRSSDLSSASSPPPALPRSHVVARFATFFSCSEAKA